MPPPAPPSTTLIAEATRRSGVVWVTAAGPAAPADATSGRPALLWHVWHHGAMYVVGGGPEQALPVRAGDRALVVVRSKASQAGVAAAWVATVDAVAPGSPQWDEVVPLLAAERLNAEEGRADRWAAECLVLRFSPVD